MREPRILLLADDLTGALEIGSKFAAAGVKSDVRTGPRAWPRAPRDATVAIVVDTETRHAGATEAARRVYELALIARCEGYSYIYKKTDSTLRGNIGAEFDALIEAYSGSPLLYVPAYPQMGRTVKNGALYVDGTLVDSTGFASDPFNPVTESHIPTLLAAQCRLRMWAQPIADAAHSAPWGITICDGETDADVEAAAKAFLGSSTFRLAAGPAGFASHLARLIDMPHGQPPALPRVRNALIVNGSLHKVSLQQVEQAKHDGFRSIDSDSIPATPAEGDWIILEQGGGTGRATLDFAKSLAKPVCQLLARFPFDALVVFGGDTAYAMVEAMGNPPLHPLGEVMEGIPISKIEGNWLGPYINPRDRDLYLVTKAGGFGSPAVLASLRSSLRER